ncbi:putative high mobility group protein 1 [Halenospora varia]|nr:putative high mobility group protein 1 [Halenospora varia]
MPSSRGRPRIDLNSTHLSQQTLIWEKVVTGLATLQDAIQTLSGAYMKHTNAVLGDHAPAEGIDSTLTKLADNPALLGDLQRQPSPARSTGGDAPAEKKERKKRQHDPNAPKRPLTPFFLYMQTARQIIANDLGPEVPKGAVSSEGTRRWSTMAPDDKQLWTNAYKDNLRLYNARMHSYRNSNPDAKDMTDQDALIYAEEHNIGADTSADAQLVGEASATAINDEDEDAEGEPEPEKEPTPPPKTPKVKASTRKSRGSQPTPASAPESIVPPSASIVPPKPAAPEKEKSPDKKRKRATKKGAAEELAGQEELKVETPKSAPKPRKKKAKADS